MGAVVTFTSGWVMVCVLGPPLPGVAPAPFTSVTIQAKDEKIVVPRAEIDEMVEVDQSLMPEGMLDTLNDREVIELIKYLHAI